MALRTLIRYAGTNTPDPVVGASMLLGGAIGAVVSVNTCPLTANMATNTHIPTALGTFASVFGSGGVCGAGVGAAIAPFWPVVLPSAIGYCTWSYYTNTMQDSTQETQETQPE